MPPACEARKLETAGGARVGGCSASMVEEDADHGEPEELRGEGRAPEGTGPEVRCRSTQWTVGSGSGKVARTTIPRGTDT
jgi:hypothetical protein